MKLGKTSFCAQIKDNLLLATEIGTNALDNLNMVPIQRWHDIKKILKQLRDPRAKEFYKTVSIDTITIAADLAERYICQREQVENIKDIPYGQLAA